MKIAYADPPYPGQAARYGRREVDHARLIRALDRFDGWALSSHSNALRDLLPLCPKRARVAAFCRTFVVFKKGVYPPYAWEPVIFAPARALALDDPSAMGVRDWVRCSSGTHGFVGAKPPEFSGWLFGILGCEPEDEFHDLFYGSGAVTRAWKEWCQLQRVGGPLFVRD